MTRTSEQSAEPPSEEASMLAARQSSKYLMMLVASVACLAGQISGQTPEAKISGIIADSTGAVIPGVQVTAVNLATGHRTVAATNEQGFYVLTNLPVGGYVIEVEKA